MIQDLQTLIDYSSFRFKELLNKITHYYVPNPKIKNNNFSHYYVPNTKIKESNVLIDGKSFFDLPVKNEEEAYEKIMKMSNNNDYTTGNLLDFVYFLKKLQTNCN